jgi:hypothetical protein
MTKEALDLALEALATEEYRLRQTGQSQVYPGIGFAITAIKQARSAPVQSCYCPNCEAMGKELAALKAQPAPVQEPFGYLEIEDIESHSEYPHNCRSVNLWYEGGEGMVAIYITPPGGRQSEDCLTAAQRQWTGLTDEERMDCIFATNWSKTPLMDTAKLIEAKLKERNT